MKLNYNRESEMSTNKEVIEQIKVLAEQLDGKMCLIDCYNSKVNWKKIEITYEHKDRV